MLFINSADSSQVHQNVWESLPHPSDIIWLTLIALYTQSKEFLLHYQRLENINVTRILNKQTNTFDKNILYICLTKHSVPKALNTNQRLLFHILKLFLFQNLHVHVILGVGCHDFAQLPFLHKFLLSITRLSPSVYWMTYIFPKLSFYKEDVQTPLLWVKNTDFDFFDANTGAGSVRFCKKYYSSPILHFATLFHYTFIFIWHCLRMLFTFLWIFFTGSVSLVTGTFVSTLYLSKKIPRILWSHSSWFPTSLSFWSADSSSWKFFLSLIKYFFLNSFHLSCKETFLICNWSNDQVIDYQGRLLKITQWAMTSNFNFGNFQV